MLKSLTDNLWQPGAVLGMFGFWLCILRSYKLSSFLLLLRTIKFSACGRSHPKMERSRQFLLKLELVSVRSHPKMNWSQHFLGILELVFNKYDLTQKWTDLINFWELCLACTISPKNRLISSFSPQLRIYKRIQKRKPSGYWSTSCCKTNLFLNNINKELSIDILKFIGNIHLEIFRKWQKI